MVDNSLVLVNFNSDMGIGLSGNSSGFYKLPLGVCIDVVATLCGVNIRTVVFSRHLLATLSIIYLFGASAHRLVIEFTALFLQLIIANVECVSSQAVITHSHLVTSTGTKLEA